MPGKLRIVGCRASGILTTLAACGCFGAKADAISKAAIRASGAGYIERPVVTAADEDGRRRMVMPALCLGEHADLSNWTAHGMRASATGTVDFTGVRVDEGEIIGRGGDYEQQPAFSVGAWRFAAVQQGGLLRPSGIFLQQRESRMGETSAFDHALRLKLSRHERPKLPPSPAGLL